MPSLWPFTTRPYQWHPALYHISVWHKRLGRAASWALDSRSYASTLDPTPLPHRVFKHTMHWLVLHSPLIVEERHHHGFDPFPDDGRILPFGSGATVFWNYRDYVFRNETNSTFQLRLWLTDKQLEGELRCDQPIDKRYRVFEKRHRFVKRESRLYRENELWREIITKGNPRTVLGTEFLHSNCAEVRYAPGPEVVIDDEDERPGISTRE